MTSAVPDEESHLGFLDSFAPRDSDKDLPYIVQVENPSPTGRTFRLEFHNPKPTFACWSDFIQALADAGYGEITDMNRNHVRIHEVPLFKLVGMVVRFNMDNGNWVFKITEYNWNASEDPNFMVKLAMVD